MAETIMRSVMERLPKNQQLPVTSRGLVVLFSEPINPKAAALLRGNHMEIERGTSLALEDWDLAEGTLVLTMTEGEKASMAQRYPGLANLYTLREYAGEQGDIVEPYGGTDEDYEMVYEHIDLMVKMVAQKIIADDQE
jgi:protein-tyrosine phosphatase